MSATRAPEEPASDRSAADREVHDQQEFDAVVDRDSRIVLSILAAVGIIAALGLSAAALVKSNDAGRTVTVTAPSASVAAVGSAQAKPTSVIDLSVIPEGKRGPDGKMHDAFTVTNFNVKAGQPTELRIDNKDEGTHSITSPLAGISIIVQPGVHTYTLLVQKAGRFEWKCIIPCDTGAGGWAMSHPGYMAGYITAS